MNGAHNVHHHITPSIHQRVQHGDNDQGEAKHYYQHYPRWRVDSRAYEGSPRPNPVLRLTSVPSSSLSSNLTYFRYKRYCLYSLLPPVEAWVSGSGSDRRSECAAAGASLRQSGAVYRQCRAVRAL